MSAIVHEARPPRWQVAHAQGRDLVTLEGDWLAKAGAMPGFPASAIAPAGKGDALHFDSAALGRWDSALIAFLWDAKIAAAAGGRTLDLAGLPPAASKLLGLLPDHAAAEPGPVAPPFRPLNWLGGAVLSLLRELGTITVLAGATASAAALAARARSHMRMADLWTNIRDAGPKALVIVSVVNFLIGAILAFVGAVQLRIFAADIYVANLVGLAMVREMAAVMTAIVMTGRTGGAYAARIATMQGREEIDALSVIGISVADYIVLPAVLALVVTMPFLYLYGCLVGMFGGFVVAISMLNVSGLGYLNQTVGAVAFTQFGIGFTKSVAFAVLIGVSSCRIGLRAGRSSAEVGAAATRAVVAGIVGVIALDALFAVIIEMIGL